MYARRLSYYLVVVSFILPLSPFMSALPNVNAAETTDAEKNAQLLTLLRNAKLVNASYELRVAISSDEILITTQKKAKATEDELKIQSVLLSKTAFDTITSGPQRVKLMFLDFESEGYSEVLVKRAEVVLFGEGKLSQKDLLASLEVKTSHALGGASAQDSAVPGPLQTNRAMALERINHMKAGGTNVSAFMKLFDEVEEAAKKDDQAQVKQQLTDLNRRLKDQEEMIKGLAQRSRTSLQSTASSSPATYSTSSMTTPAHTGSIVNSLPTDGGIPNLGARMFNMIAEPKIATYPPDMKETATRVLGQLKYMAEHDGEATKGYRQLEMVGNLMDIGRVDEARTLLNQVSQQTDPLYFRQKDRHK
jgi:hypothetical protein